MIGPDDPPPYTVINDQGKAKVLLTGDHVSNVMPKMLDSLGLDKSELQQHIAYDIGTRKLINHLSEHLDAPAVLAGYSRLVVDLNRSLEDPSVMPETSDDRVIPGNQSMSEAHRNERIHCFYTPYRKAIDSELHRFREQGVVPAFISIHSFTPQMAGFVRPWHAGILWDKDPRIPVPLMANLRAHPEGFNIGDNEPYSGKHPADYTIDHHAEAAGLPHVSIEIRQDLVDTEEGAERWATILDDALRGILADPDLYQVWQSI
ncbi:MAG: N-formylglutamate amidohydrolase [Gammaproteobacteria bacterium]|nr:N-formylglutamate amidohydrolase [Gammaproteobacteria bacterium]MDH3857570.1 N-formylglutamate amidohydrolase [Gammaproteobacteria bacterium]